MAPSCAGAAPAWAETGMKLLPLLFYLWVFEPDPRALPGAAIAIAVGFATFENVCHLAENGADNFTFLLIRGFSAGALHILCGILSGFGVSYGVPPPVAGADGHRRHSGGLHRLSRHL